MMESPKPVPEKPVEALRVNEPLYLELEEEIEEEGEEIEILKAIEEIVLEEHRRFPPFKCNPGFS